MRPTALISTIKTCIGLRIPLYVKGGPGLGKTQTAKQGAREYAAEQGLIFLDMDKGLRVPAGENPHAYFGFKTQHGPSLQPEDIALPSTNADKTRMTFLVTDSYPLEGDPTWPTQGMLLIDELPQADQPIQKTMAHLFQERNIHGHPLKSGWTFNATGNRATDRAGANRLLSHLLDRMTEIDFEPSLDDWCNWAIDNDVRVEVVSFLRFKPGLLFDFDPQRDRNATPRGWAERVSPIIDNVPQESEFELIKGAVGEGAAAEFVGYLKICRKLPNPDAILMQPDKAEVPTEPSIRYAIAGAIAHRATPDNFERVMTYARRLPPEFTVLTVLDSIRKNPDVQNTKAFTDWAIKEGEKVLM